MFRDLMTLQDRVNRLFEDSFPSISTRTGETQEFMGDWVPPVDIYEDENAITLKADIPGADPKTLDIRVEGNRLLLKGERNFEKETKRENFYRMERSYGSFLRTFALPHIVQADRVEANYDNGVLNIKLPKREDAKPKQIKIQTNNAQQNPESRFK